MNGKVVYLDTSAFVKLIMPEPESPALRGYLRRRGQLASAGLLRTEAVRALRPHGPQHVATARRAFARMLLVRLNPGLLARAGDLDPLELRSLDAVHVAAAESLGTDLGMVVAYDQRFLDAARELRLPVASPR
jgi:predicted nucleic acid-binding protein